MFMMQNHLAMGGKAPVTALSFVNSSTSTAATIVLPALQAGDIIVLFQEADGPSVPAGVTPTGFTNIANLTDTLDYRVMVDWKIAVAADNGATITGMNGVSDDRKIAVVFRPDADLITATLFSVATQYTSGNPTAQNVTSTNGPIPLVVIGCYFCTYVLDPRTFSPAADGEVANSTAMYLKYKIYNSSPADTSVDMDNEGSGNYLISFYISVN